MVNNTNGKDEEIVNKGGEESVDVLESIKLIDMEEYNSLKKAEQEKYVVYNPGLTSEAYAMMLTQANNITDLLNQIGPMMSKLSPLTQGGMDLLNADAFVNLINAVKVPADLAQQLGSLIGTISSTPVVNIVAKPLELICGAVGAMAGLVYAMIMNPYNMLSAYYTAIQQLDLETLKNRFTKDSIPNLEIAKMELNKVVIPDPDIKSYVDNGINDTMQMVDNASQMLETAVNLETTMETLQTADKQMRTYLKTINTMGMNWLLPQIQQLCDVLEMNYEAVADALCNNHFSSLENMASGHVNGFMNSLPLKFIHVNDLEKLKNHQAMQQQKDDYNSGYDDGIDDGEDLFEEYLKTFTNVTEINEVEMYKHMNEKLEEELQKLKEDEDNTDYYISGYTAGYKKGFEEKYAKSKQSDYDRGYDDGLDEGEDDGENMASKLLSVNMSNEDLEEYMTKSIEEKDFADKSEDYKSGYTEAYKSAFTKVMDNLKESETKKGHKKGYSLGEKLCNDLFKYLTDSQINSFLYPTYIQLKSAYSIANYNTNKYAYKVDNKCIYNDCIYVCIKAHTSSTTFTTANWSLETQLNETKTLWANQPSIDTKNQTEVFINSYNSGVEDGYNENVIKRQAKATKNINENDEETGYDAGVIAGQTAGQTAMSNYEAVLESQGITGSIDRYMAHDKNHNALFDSLNPTIPDGSTSYKKGYIEGYYYGFTDGYYKSIEIFK